MLPARFSAISRRRIVQLCTASFVSLALAYYHFLHAPRLPHFKPQPPSYTSYAERHKCTTPGKPCVQSELDALRLAKQGGLRSAGRPGQDDFSCPPAAYSNGSWAFNPKFPPEGSKDVRVRARSRGLLGADDPGQWGRFPGVNNWEWVPGDRCRGMERWDREEVVRHLVEDGGWLLIGDSVTENHFFSLSCLLYPHVIATPNYNNPLVKLFTNRGTFQHLYLNPASPLASDSSPINFPPGFSVSKTPLITFRRVDVLYSKAELVKMHQELYPSYPSSRYLFSNEETHTHSPSEALDLLTSPLPYGNYATMVVSTGGHWTTTLFSGYRDEDAAEEGWGVEGVVEFYEHVVSRWVREVQDRLSMVNERGRVREVRMHRPGRPGVMSSHKGSLSGAGGKSTRKKKNVIIRPYLPGHDGCRETKEPLDEVSVLGYEVYNWRHIWKFNHIFEEILSDRKSYPDIHYIPIDRPGRLRPDTHAAWDCLHIMTGAGVLAGWSRYIWHFVSKELSER
ncbi:hypothetical protein NMY22_g7961 [Coprinellus aureogranulatus]|nr:hypothetical protein NMY22_g7961 [Coprinellus aureogranulatus]